MIFGANHGCVMLFDLFESNQWRLDVFMVKYDWIVEFGFHD